MSEPAVRLNIGAGDSKIPGFIPIDAKFGDDATKLNYEDESVDEVYASHVLEHIHHSRVEATVAEWVRVLKPGGRIRICIPDFERIDRERRADPDGFTDKLYSCWLHGSHDDDNDRHRAWIRPAWLQQMLRQVGIEDIKEWEPEYEDYSKLDRSTRYGGYKRKIEIPREPKVVMVLSVPRFGPCDTFKSIADACQSIGWKFFHWGGTEWGKGLEQVIEHVIRTENPDYIFPLDYDSVFDPADCLKILEFMQRRPDVAAVWPAEAHRHMDLPLGLAPQGAAAGAYDFSGEFTQMWSGHFGCTMIRASVFKTIPHPWFWSLPDPNTGSWENSTDADIMFWKSCTMHGLKVGQINTVQIGHLEWCVKWMTPKGMIWQPIQNYRKKGKPTNAVFNGEFWVQRCKDMHNPPPQPPPPQPALPAQKEELYVPRNPIDSQHDVNQHLQSNGERRN